MDVGSAISRSVLSHQVKERLLRAIVDGRYAPGARIVETRVARELGTSQAPVREALRDLEVLGLVEMQAFRGARVRRPSAAELLEAFTVRAVLESFAAHLALERLTDAEVDELAGLVATMQAAAGAGDAFAEAEADTAFHGRLLDLSGNSTLVRLWRLLEPSSRTFITITSPGADRRRIADLHLPIVDALRRRDGASVDAALDVHSRDLAAMLRRLGPDGETDGPVPDDAGAATSSTRANRSPTARIPAIPRQRTS